MENSVPELLPQDQELQMLVNNKESGFNYRERRHDDWTENYELYRDKVTINRLTQRQSVNLPLMKQTIRTLLKDVDDMPVLYFENLDNDKEAEIFKNEYWKYTVEHNRMELQDIVDKRQVFLFGRSFTQWQVVDGKVKMTVEDPMDILVDRYCDPFNIHSSRFLIHTHIFKPFSYLENNPEYDQAAVARLKEWFATEMGLRKSKTNEQMLIEKNKKLADMGVDDIYDPILGETIVELTIHMVYQKEEGDSEEQIYKYTEAEDMEILMKKPLERIIGTTTDHFWRNHYPYDSWADDVERQDFWSDGIGDVVRTPNKVLNVWFSQLVENRTMRSFGMHYYNSNMEGFSPSTWQPQPWGWYPLPIPPGGKIDDVLQKVDIPDLSESLDEMNFVVTMLEKATGATATQQGVQTERQITLGEVQLALGEAKERVKGMSKFYTPAWKERGMLFIKLLEAAGDKIDAVTVYKKGKNTSNIYSRLIEPEDWASKEGYRCKVWSQDEKDAQDTQALQKLDVVKMSMPDNPKLNEIYQRKLLEFADLDPDEINEVMAFEEAKQQAMMSMIGQGVGMPGMPIEGQQPQSTPRPAPRMLPAPQV